jgi:glycosyltransferase involved in cell wall biosynthesis
MFLKNPKISIITVVYNAINSIETTIKSVITNSYKNIEYIIIDGGSVDGTLEIIKKYESSIYKFISETDYGIYDAMNKGISYANGDWIYILNSGDELLDNVFSSINFNLYDKIDIIYGDTRSRFLNNDLNIKAKPLSYINFKIPFCHQSCLVRKVLFSFHPFDVRYKIAADYDFFLWAYKKKYVFKYLNLDFCFYDLNGFSTKNQLLLINEYKEIISLHNTIFNSFLYKLKLDAINIKFYFKLILLKFFTKLT